MSLENRTNILLPPSVNAKRKPTDRILLRVGTDLDDTVVKHFDALILYLRDIHNLHVNISQIRTFSWGRALGISPDEENSYMFGFWHSPYFRDAEPFEGALEGLSYINTVGKNAAITARLKYYHRSITRAWINRYCPDAFPLGIHYSNNPYHGMPGESKPKIAEKLKLDATLEDSAHNAIELAQVELAPNVKTASILLRRSHNEDYLDKAKESGVKIAESWEEAIHELDKIRDIKEARMLRALKPKRSKARAA